MKHWILLLVALATRASGAEAPTGLQRSEDYRVWVGDRELVVWASDKAVNHGTHDVTSMSFTGFDLTEAVTLRVRPARAGQRLEVRPRSSRVTLERSGPDYTFRLAQAAHLLLTLDGSYERALVLSANPPHTPPEPQQVTHYFGPGVHEPGEHVALRSNDRVYLADGAVVLGSFALAHATNVAITGRGLLSLGHLPHRESYRVFRGDHTKDVLIEGLTVVNAPGWIVSFWGENERLTVRNLKLVANFRYNTDGVQTGTRGLRVEDCFLQCNDDNFSLNGVCQDVVIRRNVLWNLYNGGVFMLGWATGPRFDVRHLDIHDNVILRAGGCCDYDPKGPFSMKLYGANRRVEDLRFRDIVIEDLAAYGRWLDFQAGPASRSVIRDIHFENIELQNAWKVTAQLHGPADSPMEDISFRNVRMGRLLMTNALAGGLDLIQTRGVTIEGREMPNGIVVGPRARPDLRLP